ncbi:alpha/beta hydrolase [uncultured Turicimonas sp.]|uniref:alpha/beta hydrolase n=1 Tax=uncultured Turicimonas sp. TaxID=1918607 RepID=UPI002804A62B|nr:alpha/beta hydrolase [uncultured Turicimonas sp.]
MFRRDLIVASLATAALGSLAYAEDKKVTLMNTADKWDKTFPQSDTVECVKVSFKNRYGAPLVGDLYIPKDNKAQLPAVAVSGPFGAVKEQASGRYAQRLAENGFITLAFDPSFTGESGGEIRAVASPDINTEDFSAAVDYLSTRKDVDPNKIGILGICGFGGFALNAAANDPRIKATVTSTMYDMTRVLSKGYFDSMTVEDRYKLREKLNEQRTKDALTGTPERAGGLPDKLNGTEPLFVKEYWEYYKQPRGYHSRSLNSNEGWTKTSQLSFMNMPILAYSDEIRSPVMMMHGEKAHSLYFSQDAFKKLIGDNKELVIIPGANHVDLYDNDKFIPWQKIVDFYKKNL